MDKNWLNTRPIIFDEAKSERNLRDPARGFGFEIAAGFDFNSAWIEIDDRRNYGEDRFRALGMIEQRPFALVFTMRGTAVRIISLRKANEREIRRYRAYIEAGTG